MATFLLCPRAGPSALFLPAAVHSLGWDSFLTLSPALSVVSLCSVEEKVFSQLSVLPQEDLLFPKCRLGVSVEVSSEPSSLAAILPWNKALLSSVLV